MVRCLDASYVPGPKAWNVVLLGMDSSEEKAYVESSILWCYEPCRIRSKRPCLAAFNKFHKIVKDRGFSLAGRYDGMSRPAILLCPHGHTLKIRPADFERGIGCSFCSGRNTACSKDKLIKLADSLGFVVLEHGKSNKDFTKMMCPQKHVFNIKRNNFLNGWRCAKCSGKCSTQSNELFVESIKGTQYKLAQPYKTLTAFEPVLMVCPKGHTFETNSSRFKKGNRCPHPKCRKYVKEAICRAGFEKMFGVPFNKVNGKKSFIVNPTTGRGLELDGYCPHLKIAFEYQGEQHYIDIKHFNKTTAKDRQALDEMKRIACERAGVALMVISYKDLPRTSDKAEHAINGLIVEWAKTKGLTHLLQIPPF